LLFVSNLTSCPVFWEWLIAGHFQKNKIKPRRHAAKTHSLYSMDIKKPKPYNLAWDGDQSSDKVHQTLPF